MKWHVTRRRFVEVLSVSNGWAKIRDGESVETVSAFWLRDE